MNRDDLPKYAHELPDAERLWPQVRLTAYPYCPAWPCVVMPAAETGSVYAIYVAGGDANGILLDRARHPTHMHTTNGILLDLDPDPMVPEWSYALKHDRGDTATLNFCEPHIPVHGYKEFYNSVSGRINEMLFGFLTHGYIVSAVQGVIEIEAG